MSIKNTNEITVKMKCELEELYEILEQKNFEIVDEFTIYDTFFIPQELKINNMTSREILGKAVLIRYIDDKITRKKKRRITFKKKQIDINGNILSQKSINCDIKKTEDAKNLLKAIGYSIIMNITESDVVYGKDGLEIAIKNIKGGERLIEVEINLENPELDTIEKIKSKILELNIPIYTDNFFVKKAEIELDKILKDINE